MTEHAAVIFVFFFLAEYASIVVICILTTILFIGGYLINITFIFFLLDNFDYYLFDKNAIIDCIENDLIPDTIFIINCSSALISGLILGTKTSLMVFTFI